jgi:large exoprotein involved in heme utilization and adhesion
VQIPAGQFRSQITTLSQQPGMGYLNELTARSDVNWQPVKLAYDSWDYKQEGLTPAGAALVAVAVTWAMGPGGAGIIGNATTTAGMMANAALASLASQASISFINNKGDIGKTLKELGSSQTVKATIAAALTAGVLDKLGATATMKELSAQSGFSEKLTYNLINASGMALTNTAINGGNLEDTLRQALIGGLVDTAHGQAASQIKGLESQYLAHKLAHALAGCVAGAAAGGQCKDGAIGAALGEIVAQLMPPNNGIAYSESEKANVLALSKLVAGATSAYAGGNAQTAITTAEVAVQNNALVPALVGLAWLADKAWTAYEVAQDVAAIRDGTKTVQQVALEKGEEYVTGIIIGNIGRYGVKAVKSGSTWIQSKAADLTKNLEARGSAFGANIAWGSWKDYPKVTSNGSQYAQVGDRLYSQHAVDRMQPSGLGIPVGADAPGRNISPNIVDYVIRTGERTVTTTADGVQRTVHWSGNVGVVTENGGKIVVTVLRRGS